MTDQRLNEIRATPSALATDIGHAERMLYDRARDDEWGENTDEELCDFLDDAVYTMRAAKADLADLLAEVDRLRVAYERLQRDYQGLLDAVRRQDV